MRKIFALLLIVAYINADLLPQKKIVVADFEIAGDLGGIKFKIPHEKRIKMASQKLREALQNTNIYNVVDDKLASVVIKRISAGQYVHLCNGCDLDIAKELGADYILFPWVFRLSNLILTMHMEIKEVATGKIVIRKIMDFRGDNDKAWLRAINNFISYM